MFRKSKISFAVCAAMAAATSPAIYADEKAVEEVLVTGIRASLTRSVDMKRNSTMVSDSIVAEDLGKFPDNNIADSLQRIPGVAIDRAGGEGRYVSIRGLGPDFTSVLVNGRSIATENEERAFSFDTLASELIRKVDVFKTTSPGVKEGGLGGTVNIVTAKPFDFDGMHLAGNVKAIHEKNSGDTSPQGSVIFSNTFNDERFGVLASLTYQERSAEKYSVRNSHISNTEEEPFLEFPEPSQSWDGGYAYSGDGLEEDTWRLQEVNRGITAEKRKRIGGNLVFQFQATDDLVLTADALYSKYDIDTSERMAGNYLWAPTLSPLNHVDGNNFYSVINHGYDAGYDISGYAHSLETAARPTESLTGGLNAVWQLNDGLKMTADISRSKAKLNNRGRDRSYVLEILNQPGFLVTSNGGIPSIEYADADAVTPGANSPNRAHLRARQTSNFGTYIDSTNTEGRVDFEWDTESKLVDTLKFGSNFTRAEKSNERWDTPELIKRMYQKNAEKQAIDYESIITGVFSPGNVFGGAKLNGDVYIIDPIAYRHWMANNIDGRDKANTASGIASKNAFIANGSSWDAVKTNDSFDIKEDVTSFYVEGIKQTSIYDMPLTVSGGVRYTSTRLTSSGRSQILTKLEPESTLPGEPLSPNLVKIYSDDAGSLVAMDNDYDNWLPSISAKLDVTDSWVIRATASRTLTRATLSSLAPSLIYGATTKGARVATGNNPDLLPFVSTNLDLSFEYYYDQGNLLALALFKKDIKDFIVSRSLPEVFSDVQVTDPNYQVFQVRRPHNGPSAEVNGAELNWTHAFENGFGVAGNYTWVDSDATLSGVTNSESFALPGISDTGNLTAFYDNNGLQLRIAYNYRTSFLERPFNGPSNEPIHVGAYGSFDVSASYDINDKMTFFAEGYNVTNETVSRYGRAKNQFIGYEETGPLFALGVRMKL